MFAVEHRKEPCRSAFIAAFDETRQTNTMATQKTFQEVLKERAQSDRAGHMLFYPLGNIRSPMKITYTSLYEEAKRISRTIQSVKQFQVGRPVLLHFEDHWDVILWFWSVLIAGGLPVLSPPFSNIDDDRHKHIRALSTLLESPICFTRSKFLSLFGNSHDAHLYPIESFLDESGQESRYAQDAKINGDTCDVEKSNDDREQGIQNGDSMACGMNGNKTNDIEDEDLLVLMLTSGSTGNAKAVSITHKQALAAVSGKAAARLLPQDRPFLNWVGLDHVGGLLEIHLQALWLGADQVHVSAANVVPSPETFLDILSRHRVSRSFAPNFFLAKLVSAVESLRTTPVWDLSSLVCMVSGGEANDMNTCLAASALFSRYGAPPDVITPGFGMTETCAGSIYNCNCPEYDISRGHKIASLGKCISGIEMRITTSENIGGLAAPDEPGDLEIRGPVVFKGYYRNQVATSQAFTPDQWFRTGDRALIDSNGNLNLVGRARDVININGIKFVTADIQTAIENVLGNRVERVVVFPSAASHTEQVTVAYIPNVFPPRDEEMVDISRLVTQACLLRTATRPLVFALREKSLQLLPVSTLGKISRLKMARLFEDGEFNVDLELHEHAMLHTSNAAEQVYENELSRISEAEARLVEDVAETLGLTPQFLGIHLETSLFDIGYTSMHVIKLKYNIESRLGIDVSVIQIMKNPTIRGLAAALDAQSQHSKTGPDQQAPESIDNYDPVVVFRPRGSKTPLWLFHPGVGEVLVFVGLAQCLAADDRPVFALRAAGFEPNQQRFESIKQAVNTYAAAIRRRQPHGPYALAGYSYGTMLAFETAKQLGADGDEVRFLGSFNLPPHIKQRMRMLNWNACLLHLSHFLGLITEDVADTLEVDPVVSTLPRAEAIGRVFDIVDKARWKELGLETDALERWVDVAFGLQHMATEYDPSGQVNSIDVFHAIPLRAVAKSREIWLREYLSRWTDFAREPPRFHAVQGEHYTMIGPEHVTSFAQTLVQALKERGV
ncbi:acetyl-CoA synthetase-like protein [Hypoxylon sp. NC1633]|nr:acetyl-CoA synthetase-like protein [Hypoxylon sp. NC1633]